MGLISRLEQKRIAKEKMERRRVAKKVAIAAATTTAIGVLGGIVIAPKSGKETREDIKNKAKEVNKNIKLKSIQLKENTNEAKEKIANYVKSKKGSLKCCGNKKANEEVVEISDDGDVETVTLEEEKADDIVTE